MKDERNVYPKIFLAIDEVQERLSVVDERCERVLVAYEIEPRDQMRELLLHRETIFEVPFQLLGID